MESGGIVNTDVTAARAAIARKAKARRRDERLTTVENDLNILKDEITTIRHILEKLLVNN